jgi:hypothetical protein
VEGLRVVGEPAVFGRGGHGREACDHSTTTDIRLVSAATASMGRDGLPKSGDGHTHTRRGEGVAENLEFT